MTAPYSPVLLATPVVNPSAGGFSAAIPYVSPSQFRFAPTALDVSNLVTEPGASADDQTQALADLIDRATSEIDAFVFGSADGTNQPSLCATEDVESWTFKVINGYLQVACRFRPLIALMGMDIGFAPNSVQSIGPNIAGLIKQGRVTWRVPIGSFNWGPNGPNPYLGGGMRNGLELYVVWRYQNGYSHTMLVEEAAKGSSTIDLMATGSQGGLIGLFPGNTLRIIDGSASERIRIQSVSGTTVTTTSPLLYTHTVPDAPDFIPVTAMPQAVEQAAIRAVASLVKERGDDALLLEGIAEARTGATNPGEKTVDIVRAFKPLKRYAMPSMIRN